MEWISKGFQTVRPMVVDDMTGIKSVYDGKREEKLWW